MGMKLLEKREIAKKKAEERRTEMDEGMKLAKRVDALREATSQEEANYRTVREAGMRSLKEAIEPLQELKGTLEKEVADLEERKKKALEPITAKAEALDLKETEFKSREVDIGTQEAALATRGRNLTKSEQQLEVEKGRVDDFRHTAAENLAESENTLKTAKEDAADLRNKAQVVLLQAEVRDKETLKREGAVATRERDLELKAGGLTRREVAVIAREKKLSDREQMMSRNLRRLSN